MFPNVCLFMSLNVWRWGGTGGVCAYLKRNPVLPFSGGSVQGKALFSAELPARFLHETLSDLCQI